MEVSAFRPSQKLFPTSQREPQPFPVTQRSPVEADGQRWVSRDISCRSVSVPFGGAHSTSHITPVMCGGLPRGLLDTSHSVGIDKEDERGASFFSPEILGSHCSFIFIIGLNISLKKPIKNNNSVFNH
uniref:Uncharacterized protein n=1 Tax=Molossus molossus TaxID=27622 RepID=A0A7J8FZV7_MOLMO|nr:hypothetical protein HJG59_008228 [Molossus molossus]